MKNVLKENLGQLTNLLQQIAIEYYTKKTEVLSGSSIGQHTRHILEFYQVLVSCNNKSVSYDKRIRDGKIENSPSEALNTIKTILVEIEKLDKKQEIVFEGDFTEKGQCEHSIKSSIGREMAYCIEHSIHHQALIKAGLISMDQKFLVDDKFGVAYSTIRFKNRICAQ